MTVWGGALGSVFDKQSRAPALAPIGENACWSSGMCPRVGAPPGERGRELVEESGGRRGPRKPFLIRSPRFSGLSVDQKAFPRAGAAPRRGCTEELNDDVRFG